MPQRSDPKGKQSANERTSVSLVVQTYKITKLGLTHGEKCKQSDSERTKVVTERQQTDKTSKQSANERTSVSLVVQKYKISNLG